MTIQLKPLSEVNHQAIRLLSEKLGVADTFRFVNLQLHKYWRVVAENGVGHRVLKSFEPFVGYHRG